MLVTTYGEGELPKKRRREGKDEKIVVMVYVTKHHHAKKSSCLQRRGSRCRRPSSLPSLTTFHQPFEMGKFLPKDVIFPVTTSCGQRSGRETLSRYERVGAGRAGAMWVGVGGGCAEKGETRAVI